MYKRIKILKTAKNININSVLVIDALKSEGIQEPTIYQYLKKEAELKLIAAEILIKESK